MSDWQCLATGSCQHAVCLNAAETTSGCAVWECQELLCSSAAQQTMRCVTPATHCASSLCRLFVRLQHSTQPQPLGPSDGRAWTWSVCAVEQWRGETARP